MKQSEFVTDRLLEIANEVRSKKRNVLHAKVEGDLLYVAAKTAALQAYHQRLQRKTPRVKFFDAEMPKLETPEQAASKAGRVLSKRAVAKKAAAA